jgi:hypothetical protein
LDSVEAIKPASKDALDIPLIVETQDITAKCQESLGTFSYTGGQKLASLWRDALDQTPKPGSKRIQVEMFRAALYNEYWDLAQQVGGFNELSSGTQPGNVEMHFELRNLSQVYVDRRMPNPLSTL